MRKLLTIAVPIIFSNIISQVQMLVDRAFLGNVDSKYMSALGNVNSPLWTTMSFCFTIVTGASILISQGVGAKNKDKMEDYAASMVKWNNVIPVLLFFFWTFGAKYVFQALGTSDTILPMCLGYTKYFAPIFLIVGLEASCSVIMQTSNYTKPLIFYGIIRAGLNVLLDWILIFGHLGFPAMGIEGAAIATAISEYVGCIYAMIIFVTSKKLPTRPALKSIWKAKFKFYFEAVKLGVNTALEDFSWNVGNLILIRILNSINEMAAGIYSIVFGIEVLVVVVIGSIGNGTLTVTSEAKGSRDVKMYKGVCIIAYILSAAVSAVMLICCLLFPDQIIGCFTKDASIIAMCGSYLILMCINLYSKSANIIVGNGIRGSGNTKWMFYTQIFGTVFVVSCAALFVFVFHLGMTGVFLAVLCDEFVRAIINLCKYLRIVKKWDAVPGK